MAGHVDALYIFLLIVTGMMAVLVCAFVIFFAARYRHRPGVLAEQFEGSIPLEITWSAIPFLVFMVIFAWGAVVYFRERTPPADATDLYVQRKYFRPSAFFQQGDHIPERMFFDMRQKPSEHLQIDIK